MVLRSAIKVIGLTGTPVRFVCRGRLLLGPLDLVLAYQPNAVDRSGLRVCGTTFASDDYSDSTVRRVKTTMGERGLISSLTTSSNFEMSQRATLDDWDRNSSFLLRQGWILESFLGESEAGSGHSISWEPSAPRCWCQFSDWGLGLRLYQQDGDFVENSGNRVVLFNDLYALKWSQGFGTTHWWRQRSPFCARRTSGANYLRETLGEEERQRSGEAQIPLSSFSRCAQDVGQVSWLSDGALLDSGRSW